MKYYSALKRNALSGHEKIWRNLKCILLSERRQSEKSTYPVISTLYFGKGKTVVSVKDQWLPRVGGGGKGGMNRWSTENFQGSETVL